VPLSRPVNHKGMSRGKAYSTGVVTMRAHCVREYGLRRGSRCGWSSTIEFRRFAKCPKNSAKFILHPAKILPNTILNWWQKYFCRVPFIEHSAKFLQRAKKALGKIKVEAGEITVNGCFAECPTENTRQKIRTLPSALHMALGRSAKWRFCSVV